MPPENLVNATPVEVEYLDGKKETLSLPRLSIEQLYVWARHVRDRSAPALVALCTGRPPEWINTLADESFAGLAQKCFELNFPRALKISRSDPFMASITLPLLSESVAALTAAMTSSGASSSASSPAPAPSGSAAASGTASSSSPPAASSPSSPPPAASAPPTNSAT